MFKKLKPKALDRDGAEEIGVQALTFLAADDTRLARFLSLTGIAPGELIAGAREAAMLAAVLEHLSSDESSLLMFCAEQSVPPEHVAAALALFEKAM